MPQMDGFETCRNLQADALTKDIPVIIVSNKSNKVDRVWALEQGADISKPCTVDGIRGVMSGFN